RDPRPGAQAQSPSVLWHRHPFLFGPPAGTHRSQVRLAGTVQALATIGIGRAPRGHSLAATAWPQGDRTPSRQHRPSNIDRRRRTKARGGAQRLSDEPAASSACLLLTARLRALVGGARPQTLLGRGELTWRISAESALPNGKTTANGNIGKAQGITDKKGAITQQRLQVSEGAFDAALEPDHRPVPLVAFPGQEAGGNQRVEVHAKFRLAEQ